MTAHNLKSSKRSGGSKANQSDITALDASAYLPVMSTTVRMRKRMPGRGEDLEGLRDVLPASLRILRRLYMRTVPMMEWYSYRASKSYSSTMDAFTR